MSGRQEVKFQAQGLFLKCSILKSLLAQKVFVPNCSQGARDFSVTSVLMENVGLWKQMNPVCSKGILLGQELGLADARLCPVHTRSSVFRWYPQAFALSQLPCGASRDGQLEKSLPLTIHCTSNQASLFFFFSPLFSYSVCKKQHNDIQDKKKKVSFLMLLSHLFLSSYFCRKIGHCYSFETKPKCYQILFIIQVSAVSNCQCSLLCFSEIQCEVN